ncbi:MAG: hypothetical protein AAFA34_00520 [Thermoplasmata archaeon]
MALIPPPRGIPASALQATLDILRSQTTPMKRRALLDELDRRGHRISLAGLNRILQHCAENASTIERPDGVSALPVPTPSGRVHPAPSRGQERNIA